MFNVNVPTVVESSVFRSRSIFLAFVLTILAFARPAAGGADAELSGASKTPSESARLNSLRAMLAEHEAILAGLHTRYKDKHPYVIQVKAEIADLNRAIQDQLEESASLKQIAAKERRVEQRVAQTGHSPGPEKAHESRGGLIASLLVLKSGLASIQSVLDAADLSIAQTLAQELANDFASTSRGIDNTDFRIAAEVINRKLVGLMQAIGEKSESGKGDSINKTTNVRKSKALVEGLLTIVPDIQRFSEISAAGKE